MLLFFSFVLLVAVDEVGVAVAISDDGVGAGDIPSLGVGLGDCVACFNFAAEDAMAAD
jgi:hypothetical protein